LSAWGFYSGFAGISVYRYFKSDGAWTMFTSYKPTNTADAPLQVCSAAQSTAGDLVAIKLVPHCPTGEYLKLRHMDLAVNDYRDYTPYLYGRGPGLQPAFTLMPGMVLYPSDTRSAAAGTGTMFRSGKGTGPVQFTGNLGGKIDSVTVDRIGLSIDICEVNRDPNNS
jgi:hypothetical protein